MKTFIKVELIDEFIKQNGISLNKFCKLSGLSASTIKRMRENRNFNSYAILKLARVLKLQMWQVVNAEHDKIVK